MKAKFLITLGSGLVLAAGFTACTQTEKTPMTTESVRAPAGIQDDAARLVYVTYGKDGKANREEITAAR